MSAPPPAERRPGAGSSVELRDLRYFASVARTGNFGRAAQELRVSQPTISHQIRKLEDELGSQLLVRHARGVTLTPSGACLLQRLDTILHLLAAPLEPAAEAAALCGTVSLALPAEMAPLLVPLLMARVQASWPGVTLDIQQGVSGEVEAWVLNGRADVAVMQDPPALDTLRIEPLVTEGLGVVASPRAAVAESAQPLRLRELAALPLILPNPQHWIRRRLASAGFQRGLRLEPAFQIDGAALAKEMVRNGLGCAVLPSLAARDEIARGTLVFRAIEQPSLGTTHAIAVRRTAAAPVVAGFAAVLREVMCTLVSGGAWCGTRLVAAGANGTGAGEAVEVAAGTWRPATAALRHGMEFAEGD
jgi:LysR family nitrogen assimilation transcriptional regulator